MGINFSKNLKYLREKRKISQAKVAELVGVNQSTITRWETNEISPSIDNVETVADAFNVPLPDLLIKDLSKDDIIDREFNVMYKKYNELPKNDKELINNIIETRNKQIDKEKIEI